MSCDTNIFNRCLLDCGLCDIGFSGQPFTWQRRNIRRRLDRVVANAPWSTYFATAKVKHMPKLKSDHVPILIDFDAINSVERGNKPFRFLMPWLAHDNFNDFLQGVWRKEQDLLQNISNFSVKVKQWNKEVFGHILRRKSRILSRLEGVSHSLSFQQNPFLENLQKELWKDYEKILIQEEMYWKQVSRCEWIKFGDKNSKYFHIIANNRRRRNKVLSLKNEEGEWIEDQTALEDMGVNYFKSIFSTGSESDKILC